MADIHPLTAYRLAQEPQLTQAELACRLEVDRSTLHRWENFQRRIDADRLPLVVRETGIPAKELRPDLFEKHERLFGEAAQ